MACSPGLPDIAEIVSNIPDLSTFFSLAQDANLTDTLSSAGPLNVFAPTNDAFSGLFEAHEIADEEMLIDRLLPGSLREYLENHMVADGAVCTGVPGGSPRGLMGAYVWNLAHEQLEIRGDVMQVRASSWYSGGIFKMLDHSPPIGFRSLSDPLSLLTGVNTTIVGSVDAGNGVLYLIDTVLLRWGPSAETVFNSIEGNFFANGDGRVTEDELRAEFHARRLYMDEDLVQAFMAVDADGDGVELDEVLSSLYLEDRAVQSVMRIMSYCDVNVYCNFT